MERKKEEGLRFRGAYPNAQVKTTEQRIEKVFGLPQGSVQINRANGKNAYGNKKIGNLKDEYSED